MEAYHFRITGDKNILNNLTLEYVKKFNPKNYLFCFEVSKENVPHCHGHLEYEKWDSNKTKLLSTFMKNNGLSGRYYHQKIKKSIEHNILYVIKDKDILRSNFLATTIELYKSKTLAIEEDKQKQPCDKLIDRFKIKYAEQLEKEQHMNGIDIPLIKEFIDDVYIIEWNKLAPTNGLSIQYVKTICKRLNICGAELKSYYNKEL